MVGVVVTGHGGFAAGMAANVKMLAGSDAELKAVDFADGMDVEVFEKQLAEAIDSYADCEAVLVLADIAGGTPYNRAAGLSMTRPKVRVISGLNKIAASSKILEKMLLKIKLEASMCSKLTMPYITNSSKMPLANCIARVSRIMRMQP